MEKIYYSFIDLDNEHFDFDGFCQNRIDYLNSFTDKKRKNQSYYVWKLLLFALKDLGFSNDLMFYSESGKWFLKDLPICFSLSHTENLVAVVVSDFKVGVDVEKVSEKSLKLQKRYIKDDCSIAHLNTTNIIHFLTKKWTEEECKFKANNSIDKVYSTLIKDKNGIEFMLSCTSNEIPKQILLEKII